MKIRYLFLILLFVGFISALTIPVDTVNEDFNIYISEIENPYLIDILDVQRIDSETLYIQSRIYFDGGNPSISSGDLFFYTEDNNGKYYDIEGYSTTVPVDYIKGSASSDNPRRDYLTFKGFKFAQDESYTVDFFIKAEKGASINVGFGTGTTIIVIDEASENYQISGFNNSETTVNITFYSEGSNNSIGIETPKYSYITNASLDITGYRGNLWNPDENLINGLIDSDQANQITIADFNNDGIFEAIRCYIYGFKSYYYNESGSNWVSDSSLKNGINLQSSPTAVFVDFDNDGTYELITSGGTSATVYGYHWNSGSNTWVSNSTLVNGFPVLFGMLYDIKDWNEDGYQEMILHYDELYPYELRGYYYNGSIWIRDDTLLSGLPTTIEYGLDHTINDFNNDGIWEMISVNRWSSWNSYYWNNSGSNWVSDSSLKNGLTNVGIGGAPELYNFNNENEWNMIVGTYDANPRFRGFSWINYPTNVTIDIGNDGISEFNYIGILNTTNTTTDFSNSINDYLQYCTAYSYYNCSTPINISVDGRGKIELSNLILNYTTQWLTNCSESLNYPTINYSIYDENTTGLLNAELDIDFYVSPTDTTYTKQYTFNFTDINQTSICIQPSWATYEIDAFHQYDATDYATRYYQIASGIISNITSQVNLWLALTSEAGLVKFIVYDQLGHLASEITIEINKYIPSTGSYETIANIETDDDGTAYTYLIPYNYYRYILKEDGIILRSYEKALLTTETVTLRLLPETGMQYFDYYGNIAVQCPCTYSNISHVLTCMATDTSGLSATYHLLVKQKEAVGYTTICDNTTTDTTTAIMYCTLPDGSANNFYQYTFWADFSDTSYTLCTGFVELMDSVPHGTTGVFVAFIIWIIAVTAGLAMGFPVMGILMGDLAIVMMYMLDWYRIGTSALIGLVAFSLIIGYMLRK